MRVLSIATILSALLGICNAMVCDYENDKLLGSTCFEFVELPLADITLDASLYEVGEAYCSSRGKHLAIAKTPGEQYFLASGLKSLRWNEALVGLRYQKTPWTWTADGTYLRGQGCARTGVESDLIASLPSTYSSSMTVEKCVDFCAKEERIFSAIQDGSYCYCSNIFVWDESAANCSTSCSGRSDQQCGSAFNSAIQFTAEDSYDNWQGGRPTVGGGCAAIKVDGNLNSWVDTSCSEALPFLCKFVETTATPFGSDRSACSQNACYYYFSTPELNWQAADRYCIKSGGRLATIESEDRQGIVSAILSDPNIKATLIWIGASNADWYFPDESALTLREGWASSQEPVSQDVNSCSDLIVGSLSANDLVYGYRSRPCLRSQDSDATTARFICSSLAQDEEEVTLEPPTTRETTTTTKARITTRATQRATQTQKPSTQPPPTKPPTVPTNPTDAATTRKRGLAATQQPSAADADLLIGLLGDVAAVAAVVDGSERQTSSKTIATKKASTNAPISAGKASSTQPVVLQGDNAKQIAALDSDSQLKNKQQASPFGEADNVVEANDLPWWSILLIVIASLILISLVVLVLVYVCKRNHAGGKTSGRISPLSNRPGLGIRPTHRINYANSRQSSARTTHGRNNQVLLY